MKAQVSIEFMMYTGVFILAFMSIYFVFSQMGNEEYSARVYNEMFELAERITVVFSAVNSMGEGSCYTLSLPSTLSGMKYKLIIINPQTYDPLFGRTALVKAGNNFVYAFSLSNVNITSPDYFQGNSIEIPGGEPLVLKMEGGNLVVYKNEGGCK